MSVRVHHLTKRFSGPSAPAAVSDVSFEAPRGRVTALLGPSGCGKTTLLRLIAGLEQPDSGMIYISDKDVVDARPSTRSVGFVFQSYALFGHMTVADNIGFGLAIRGVDKREIRARVEELLSLVQLEGLERRFSSELSGGQRQRVALARALAVRPNVLLLDEPFGALDARVRGELRDFLVRLLEQMKVTTLLVTHDQEEALELAARVVLLDQGRVLQVGSPDELYDRPECAEVAAFLGATNVLSGVVQAGRVIVCGFELAVPAGVADGTEVQAYVRPSEIRLYALPTRINLQVARVERVTRVGAHAKVELTMNDGLQLTALVPKAEVDALGAQRGARVLVELAAPMLFPARTVSQSQVLRNDVRKASKYDLRRTIPRWVHARIR